MSRPGAVVLLLALTAASAARGEALVPLPEMVKAVFPDSTASARRDLELSDTELDVVSKALGRRVDLRKYSYLEVQRQGARAGWIFALDVLGQSQPISFAVAVGTDLAVKDIEVLAYRESHGEEIREPRFRRQFVGKKLAKDPIALDKDISAISGATISARSATYAARKALALAEILNSRAGAR
jgi:Na+-translocating ferredoxin:NAD+ oxidoreductase RnfG subunit